MATAPQFEQPAAAHMAVSGDAHVHAPGPQFHNLHGIVAEHATMLAGQGADISNIRKDLSDLAHSVRALTDTLQQRLQPQWGTLISAATLGLGILSAFVYLFLGGYVRETDTLKGAHNKLADLVQEHVMKAGHPGLVLEKVKINRDDIQEVAEHLREHMLSSGHPAVVEQLKDIKRRINIVESWQRDNNVKNSARIERLEGIIEDRWRRRPTS